MPPQKGWVFEKNVKKENMMIHDQPNRCVLQYWLPKGAGKIWKTSRFLLLIRGDKPNPLISRADPLIFYHTHRNTSNSLEPSVFRIFQRGFFFSFLGLCRPQCSRSPLRLTFGTQTFYIHIGFIDREIRILGE